MNPGLPKVYEGLKRSGYLQTIYLEEWVSRAQAPLEQTILALVVAADTEATARLPNLRTQLDTLSDWSQRQPIVELVQKILVYKFHALSREEIERMFTTDLQNRLTAHTP